MAMDFIKKLPPPQEIKDLYPVSCKLAVVKAKRDDSIKAVLSGKSPKFILIVGPCSADREDAVLEYVVLLSRLQEQVQDIILIVPRIYTNKPRSLGTGYKGMLYQPSPTDEEDIFRGIVAVRKLHIKLIGETELTSADEMLYPSCYMYLSDLLSYVTVGARSSENQEHRFVASGIDVLVGIKNPLGGNLTSLLSSITVAQTKQRLAYRDWDVKTSGNPYAHAVLRGALNNYDMNVPNYHYETLNAFCALYERTKLLNTCVIVDVNHSNSGKQWFEQMRIAIDVVNSKKKCESIDRVVKGIMIESYLQDSNQNSNGNEYGLSITDPCLGWEKTEKLILQLAELLC